MASSPESLGSAVAPFRRWWGGWGFRVGISAGISGWFLGWLVVKDGHSPRLPACESQPRDDNDAQPAVGFGGFATMNGVFLLRVHDG